MITAVDSNVLLDVFSADPAFGRASREALRRCLAEGGLIACDVVWAEVAAAFDSPEAAADALDGLGLRYSPTDAPAAQAAGTAWCAYRRQGGSRQRVIADFLVGAHARARADRLLSRDRGFYRSEFADLAILDPSVSGR
jgi:predicted nucleic acid-binding protein